MRIAKYKIPIESQDCKIRIFIIIMREIASVEYAIPNAFVVYIFSNGALETMQYVPINLETSH